MWRGEIEQEEHLIAIEASGDGIFHVVLTRQVLFQSATTKNLLAHTTFSDFKSSLSKLIEELYGLDFTLS